MGSVRRQQEHLSFADYDVLELAFIHDLQHHCAFILVEPFRCLIDVVVGSSIWSSYDLGSSELGYAGGQWLSYHNCNIFVVDAVIIDRRFQKVGVFGEPVGDQ